MNEQQKPRDLKLRERNEMKFIRVIVGNTPDDEKRMITLNVKLIKTIEPDPLSRHYIINIRDLFRPDRVYITSQEHDRILKILRSEALLLSATQENMPVPPIPAIPTQPETRKNNRKDDEPSPPDSLNYL